MVIDYLLMVTAILSRGFASQINGLMNSNVTLNGTQDSNVTYLINSMLKNYDIRLRPNFGEKALVLDLDIAMASFDAVSEVNMDFTLTLYLYQYWRDERLAWSPNSKNESITLGGDFSQKIWVPDTFLANDKHSYLHDVTETNKMIKLYSDGYVSYGMRFTSTLACKMDLRSFPLDRQNFSVEIESYGYTTDDLFMRWRNGRKSIRGVMDTEIPQFRMLNFEALDRIETTATGKYQRLSLVLVLRRSVGYYMFQTYFPSTLIVALSWISFWINHEATAARVALGVTTVLTMTTISTGVRASLPRISYIKAIDIYLVMCFVFVFAALLEYAAVNYTYWGSNRMNKKIRRHQSDLSTESSCGTRRKVTSTVKEFPTWDMFVKDEENDSEHPEMCPRHRRKSQISDGNKQESEPLESERRLENVQESDEEIENFGRTSPILGRVSPLPGLLQQLQRHSAVDILPYDNSKRASSSAAGEETSEDSKWPISCTGEFRRPSSPSVVLHSASALRRRPPSSTPAICNEPYEQRVTEVMDADKCDKNRRGTHPANLDHRPIVSFKIWRSKSVNAVSRSSIFAPGRLHQLRHTSFSLTRREFIASLRKKAKAVKSAIPRINDVNVIDKWSRGMFPLSFVIFNFVYWCYYVFIDWKD